MSSIYDTVSALPLTNEEFDEVYVKETGERRAWLRSPGETNYSWVFQPGDYLYSPEGYLDSWNTDSLGFQFSFWYNITERSDFSTKGAPLFSFDRDSIHGKIFDKSAVPANLILNDENIVTVIPTTPFKTTEFSSADFGGTYPLDMLTEWDGNTLQLDSDTFNFADLRQQGFYGRSVGPGSLKFGGNENPTLIRSNSSLVNFTNPFDPFTIATYHDPIVGLSKNTQTTAALVNFEDSGTTLGGTFKIDVNGITHHGVKFILSDSNQAYHTSTANHTDIFTDELIGPSTFDNGYGHHRHHTFAYDGYDFYYYNRNNLRPVFDTSLNFDFQPPIKATIDSDNHISLGDLIGDEFFRDKDAGFQIKVAFPYSTVGGINQNGVLFSVGGTPNRTRIELVNDSNGNAGKVLQFECGNLLATTSDIPLAFDTPGFRSGPDHIISWDYDVSAGRMRLWIDGSLKIDQSGGTWAGDAWAKVGVSSPITSINDISPITNSSIRQIDTTYGHAISYGYGGITHTSPIATVVSNGNIDFKYKRNNFGGRTSFSIGASGTGGPILPINQNKIYYFEMTTTENIARYQITLQDAGWDGNSDNGFLTEADRGKNSNGDSRLANIHQSVYGDISNWTGVSTGNKHTATNQKWANRIHQNQRISINNTTRHSWIIDTASAAPRGFYFENGVYKFSETYDLDLPNYAVLGGGVILSFNGWDIGGTATNNQTINITFNRDDWVYDPINLYNSYADYENGINPIGSEDAVYNGTNILDWPVSTAASRNSLNHKLRYYHTTFKPFENQSLVVGGERYKINSEKEHGLAHAQAHVARTGGNIINVSTSAQLEAALYTEVTLSNGVVASRGSANNGDAILIAPGYYNITGAPLGPSGTTLSLSRGDYGKTSIFNTHSDVLICGNTDNPEDIKIAYGNEVDRTPVFAEINDATTAAKIIFANQAGTTNELAFVRLDLVADQNFSSAENVLFYKSGGKINKCVIDYRRIDSKSNAVFGFTNIDPGQRFNCIIENCHFILSKDINYASIAIGSTYDNLTISNSSATHKIPNLDTTADRRFKWKEYGHNRYNLGFYDSSQTMAKGKYLFGNIKNFHVFSETINPFNNAGDSVQPGFNMIRSNYLKNTGILNNPQNSTELLIHSEGSYKSLLRLDDNGIIRMKDGLDARIILPSQAGITPTSTNGWIYTTIKYDQESKIIYLDMTGQDGSTVSYSRLFFSDSFNQDSHYFSNTTLKIGAVDSWDPVLDSFVKVTIPSTFPSNGIKQFHELLFDTDSLAVKGSFYPTGVPVENQLKSGFTNNDYRFYLAQTEATSSLSADSTDGILFSPSNSITSRIDAPYPSGILRWYVNGLYKQDSNSFTDFRESDYTGTTLRGEGGTQQSIGYIFDSSYLFDPSKGEPLNVLLNFRSNDDQGKAIQWNLDEVNEVTDRFDVGHNSSKTTYIIKQVNRNSKFGHNHSATINFSCRMADSLDSSNPLFFYDEDRTTLEAINRHTFYYNRFAAEFIQQEGFPWFDQLAELSRVDSTISDSDFTFIEDSFPSIAIYSTVGSLP